MGALLAQGIPAQMGVISDDAGQFNVFGHALCWIHAEHLVNRLIPANETQRKAVRWAGHGQAFGHCMMTSNNTNNRLTRSGQLISGLTLMNSSTPERAMPP